MILNNGNDDKRIQDHNEIEESENKQEPDDNAVMAAVKEAQMGITFKTCIDDNGEEEDF